MALYILCIISITIIIICYLIYKKNLPDHYDKLINDKRELINKLDKDITDKQSILKDLNNNDLTEIKGKINYIINNNIIGQKENNKNNNTIYIFLFILISTIIILYFTYKWTYLINPETINKGVNNIKNNFNDLLNSFSQ